MTKTIKTSRTTRKSSKTAKQTNKTAVVKNDIQNFTGTITATHLYRRQMPEFKNCQAYCWLIVNEAGGIYHTANSYNGNTPRASWKPEHYRYDLTEKAKKLIATKIEQQGYTELEVTDWPQWLTNAKRRAKYDMARNPGQALDALLKGKARVKAC